MRFKNIMLPHNINYNGIWGSKMASSQDLWASVKVRGPHKGYGVILTTCGLDFNPMPFSAMTILPKLIKNLPKLLKNLPK